MTRPAEKLKVFIVVCTAVTDPDNVVNSQLRGEEFLITYQAERTTNHNHILLDLLGTR